MRHLAVAIFLFAVAASAQTERDVVVDVIASRTTRSLGEFTNQSVIWQGNAFNPGVAGYFEAWKGADGLVLGGSATRTDSQLMDLRQRLIGRWRLDRYKLDAAYEHRFRYGHRVRPYLGAGTFLVILWGGPAPAHSAVNHTGWDVWGGFIAPAGFDVRLSQKVSLRAGGFVDIGKASTYGDTTYTASVNLMFEPQLGIAWRLK